MKKLHFYILLSVLMLLPGFAAGVGRELPDPPAGPSLEQAAERPLELPAEAGSQDSLRHGAREHLPREERHQYKDSLHVVKTGVRDSAHIARAGVRDSAHIARAGVRDSVHTERKALKPRNPSFIAAKVTGGTVFNTNDFAKAHPVNFFTGYALKFALASRGDKWEDIAYGMPYYGAALYTANYGSARSHDLGRPYGIYVLQGASLARIARGVSLNYEWNVGATAGWKAYDPIDNPENVAIGSDVNVHVGLGFYLQFYTRTNLDFRFGTELSHSSNGANRLPNAGVNMGGLFFEAVYNFNRDVVRRSYDPSLRPPDYDKHFVSEILFNMSSRQVMVDTTGTRLSSPYIDRKFTVLGLNYAIMRVPNYRYRYGAGLDLLYDESSGVTGERVVNPLTDREYDRIKRGSVGERFSLGISARGELVLPAYSIFANLGWNMLQGNSGDNRFYQIIAAKIYLKDNFFGTFGIRATHFSKAQFLFWSLGYTIDHSPIERRLSRARAGK